MTNLEALKSWSTTSPTAWPTFFLSYIDKLLQGLGSDVRLMTDEVLFTCFV